MLVPALLATLLAATAEPPVAVQPAAAVAPVPRAQVAIGAVWLPAGKIMSGASGEQSGADAATAYGFVPSFDGRISRRLTLGIAMPILFNVRADALVGDAPSTEIQAIGRVTGWFPVTPDVSFFLRGGAGFYLIAVPDRITLGDADAPQGLLTTASGGATWNFSERAFVSAEIGAHLGYRLGDTRSGVTYPQSTAYVQGGLGVGARF
jgi:hypothetical protein